MQSTIFNRIASDRLSLVQGSYLATYTLRGDKWIWSGYRNSTPTTFATDLGCISVPPEAKEILDRVMVMTTPKLTEDELKTIMLFA